MRVARHVSLLVAAILIAVAPCGFAQSSSGDWWLDMDGEGTAFERRIAATPALEGSPNDPEASMAFRRMQVGDPIELLLFRQEPDEGCKYSDWQLAVDNKRFDIHGEVLGEGEVTILEGVTLSAVDDLWKAIRTGSRIAVRFNTRCGSFFSTKVDALHVYTFSLRGSSAALDFVRAVAE